MHPGETVPRLRRRTPAFRAVAALTALAVAAASIPAHAQAPPAAGLPIIRDAEIEQLLRDYTAPILRVAGLAQQNVQIVIINERSFNAFVVDGRRIFVNVGALMESKTPNEIIGVLAHETGHIAGGHLSRLRDELANAQTAAIIALLLGLGAVAAGARAGAGSGVGNLGAAALQAPQSVIQRSLLAYVRAQEEQADKAGVKFLNATGQSPRGMYETFKRFADKIQFSVRYIDPYLQTHPMPAERVEALAEIAKSSPNWDKKDPPELQQRHDMMRAKLSGFIERPDTVANRYPPSDTSMPARYARAISAYRHADLHTALVQIDALLQAQPANPYLLELKGQALLENGRAAEAIAPLRRAAAIAPNATLIRMMLGQALVATDDKRNADEAIPLLRTTVTREPDMPDGYSQLAMAYGRKGDLAEADLAAAQAAFARGDFKTARDLATRAKTRFPTGSPGWVRADDIVTYKPPPGSIRRN
ncbi:MAG TPA: M48 family metalloprotease [Xanthobacteraceae bacterium]|nr:M48 family metalloprotease [Xanthobacteraceae bacterium]